MGFDTSSNAIVLLALWIGAGVVVLAVLMLLYVLFLRYRLIVQERRRSAFVDKWRALLLQSLESIPDSLPYIKYRDWAIFLSLWNQLRSDLTGEGMEKLNEFARRSGVREMALRFLKERGLKQRMLAITALGLLGDKSAWAELKELAVDKHPSVSLAAISAMVRIDGKAALPFCMHLIISRDDWPAYHVAGILLEASPDIACAEVGNAALTSSEKGVLRLIRYMGIMPCNTSTPVLRRIMEKYPSEAIIAACLKSIRNPDGLDLARKYTTHSSWYVRVQAVTTLGRLGLVHDRDRVVDMLSDPQWWVRYRAAQALGNLPEAGMDELEKISHKHPDRYARDIAVQVIAERHTQ